MRSRLEEAEVSYKGDVMMRASSVAPHAKEQKLREGPRSSPALLRAGLALNPGDVEKPSPVWTSGDKDDAEMPAIYGHDGPRIYGLDKCNAYREAIPKMGAAGLPNSGTNALFSMMTKNCDAPFLWEVPWQKHSMLHNRPQGGDASIMPIVLVKDPLQWMFSTCRKQYFEVHLPPKSSCPSPVNTTGGNFSAGGDPFESLIEGWSKWMLEYMNADIPVLMVRFEDLLFSPEALISQVCGCLGFSAKSSSDFKILESLPKWGNGHGHPSNRSQTIARFSKKHAALMRRFTLEDKLYIRSILKKTGAESLMNFFHYSLDTATTDSGLLESSDTMELVSTLDWGEDDDDTWAQVRSPRNTRARKKKGPPDRRARTGLSEGSFGRIPEMSVE
jgi:hypothetical protein